ncbi:phosphoglycerate mutase (2,3-diphosphoglycerate-independent) [Amylibacter kogurei]|uniref:2,3-bisphosphoglycerate-independent phosphoglycerate mutase n=1 Tax=Paramylibacter kogurei TaxID=1889778 RepID=A0A2G5KAW8_9RHOB|nr:2,3-bisphosphoglycerate-independent phosphoglycerate mutase [Amylibacter kogurei]PIB26668.1 phosphoglycerate mutase (2,3-diphosphoglycerate-independent) [Amylibacter kogurei]
MTTPKPVILCILDGWGLSDVTTGNAVALAKTPTFDRIMADYPSSTLITYGTDVGLPKGQMGNSEVGHMNIGAGRVVEMDLRKIEGAIERGEFDSLPGITRFIEAVKNSGGVAHLCGVLSDGGVHSHVDHMIATTKAAVAAGLDVKLHLFGDGRDVAPKSAIGYLEHLERELGDRVEIASISGRYFAMDRDNRWERVAQAFGVMVHGDGTRGDNARAVIEAAYANGVTDEFIPPTVLGDYAGMRDGDGILCLNFRADRAREIMAAIGDPAFEAFDTGARPSLEIISGFGEYSDAHNAYMDAVFPNEDIKNTLGEWVSKHGRKQFRIAETEKYPHVTFFLNGGVETPALEEHRYLAPSPKVATYDLQPEMSSGEVTEHLIEAITQGGYDLIVVNYANPDMVGHTGDLDAGIAACESVDRGLAAVMMALDAQGGAMILCADHGNCETMIDPKTGGPHTAHTTNPVPVALVGGPKGAMLRNGGRLADLAPSLLVLMGLEQPAEMTGESLIIQ